MRSARKHIRHRDRRSLYKYSYCSYRPFKKAPTSCLLFTYIYNILAMDSSHQAGRAELRAPRRPIHTVACAVLRTMLPLIPASDGTDAQILHRDERAHRLRELFIRHEDAPAALRTLVVANPRRVGGRARTLVLCVRVCVTDARCGETRPERGPR